MKAAWRPPHWFKVAEKYIFAENLPEIVCIIYVLFHINPWETEHLEDSRWNRRFPYPGQGLSHHVKKRTTYISCYTPFLLAETHSRPGKTHMLLKRKFFKDSNSNNDYSLLSTNSRSKFYSYNSERGKYLRVNFSVNVFV